MTQRQKSLSIGFISVVLSMTIIYFLAPFRTPLRAELAELALGPAAQTSPQSKWFEKDEELIAKIKSDDVAACTDSEWTGVNSNFSNLAGINYRVYRPYKTEEILRSTEDWESQSDEQPGYPALVQNTKGRRADGDYYLFYSVHDAPAGIALAKSSKIDGDFLKRVHWPKVTKLDSRVLKAPIRPRQVSHFSSPSIVWDRKTRNWFLYFHYYSNEFADGNGHQKTAVAISAELDGTDWHIVSDDNSRYISTMPAAPGWANSQSSYHAVARLDDGVWLALLRGTSIKKELDGTDIITTALALATSRDGIEWSLLEDHPFITAKLPKTVLRPMHIICDTNGKLSVMFQMSKPGAPRDQFSQIYVAPVSDLSAQERIWEGITISDGAISMELSRRNLYLFTGNRRIHLK